MISLPIIIPALLIGIDCAKPKNIAWSKNTNVAHVRYLHNSYVIMILKLYLAVRSNYVHPDFRRHLYVRGLLACGARCRMHACACVRVRVRARVSTPWANWPASREVGGITPACTVHKSLAAVGDISSSTSVFTMNVECRRRETNLVAA